MFKFKYACEYCEYEILALLTEVSEVCPVYNDTGNTRPNIEIYKCTDCIHYINNDECNLALGYSINDIKCPKTCNSNM